ncbi:MAG: hypothetical protein AB7Q17_05205 [Phycisphaerae bacterium]
MSEPETIVPERPSAGWRERGAPPETTAARGGESASTRAGESPPPDAAALDERLAALQRIDRGIVELRGLIEAKLREDAYHEFSIARLIGAVLQVIVVGLVVLALLDWIFSGPLNTLLTKLAFAAFFQLAALTGFVVSQARR